MTGKRFGALGCYGLIFFGAQVEQVEAPLFDVSTLDLPKVQADSEYHQSLESPLVSMSRLDFPNIGTAAFDLPARFVSWSHKVKKFVDMASVQKICLTTAVYFEARSESALGQLAVATVVLNRVQKSKSSICGIVYQGSDHLNACQFSFACDGIPEVVDDVRAWKTASEVSEVATAGNTTKLGQPMQLLATATNYHADYVKPKWSKSLTRLTQIGRHIFYSPTPSSETRASRKDYI